MKLERLVDEVHRQVGPFVAGGDGPMHFVGYSLGGLLARAYIARHRPAALGRVVLLGTPNGGSELADLLGGVGAYQWFFGSVGGQLGTRPDTGLAAVLGVVDYPMGVVAGNRAWDLLGWAIIPGPNDGRVSVARTRVAGMTEHLVLPVGHTFMVISPAVLRATTGFLQLGRFGIGG